MKWATHAAGCVAVLVRSSCIQTAAHVPLLIPDSLHPPSILLHMLWCAACHHSSAPSLMRAAVLNVRNYTSCHTPRDKQQAGAP